MITRSARTRRDCNLPQCGCEYFQNLGRELSGKTAVLSIYSRDDAVVPYEASVVTGGRNVEVGGTHVGLVYNREVYRVLARSLP